MNTITTTTPRRVIGVDPALTSIGLVVLERFGPGYGPQHAQVLARSTLTTKATSSLYDRSAAIVQQIVTLVQSWHQQLGASEAVVEDPTDQVMMAKGDGRKGHQLRGPSSIAKMGVGVGAVLAGLSMTDLAAVTLVPVAQWLPRQRAKVAQRHEVTVDRIRRGVGLPPDASEHEVMAAGVADWWLQEERQRALRKIRGIPEPPAPLRRPRRRRGR